MATISDQHQKVFQHGKVVKITKEVAGPKGAKVTLDVPKLKQIFQKYKDCLVAVYTVTGPFRSGKSFLQNLLVRYLKGFQLAQSGKSVTLNLGSPDEEITRVFEFKSGQTAHTKGVHILDEPFLIEFNQNGGTKKVALFLVDTQGLFDIESSERDVTIMGTLNFLLSSLQCFNVKERIDKVQLDYIFKFAVKVEAINERQKDASPFQKGSLMFIVRDWLDDDEDEDYPYGLKGGEKYFTKTTLPNEQKAQEHKMMQKFFHNAFGEISCFLMPEPGKAVRKRDVTLEKLDEEFCDQMLDLFKFLTNPNKIVIKKIGGKEQTCGELCDYMEVVAAALNSDSSLDDPQSLIMINYDSRMHSLTSKCALQFIEKIQESKKNKSLWERFRQTMRGASAPGEIKSELLKMQDGVMADYRKDPKCGEPEFEKTWEEELIRLLEQIKNGFIGCAVAEKEFVERIKDFHSWVTKNASGHNFNSESFKEAAKKKREELLEQLKRTISENIYKQCHDYFRNQTNAILAETAKEVEAYMAGLERERVKIKIWMGALCWIPFVGIGTTIAGAVKLNQIKAREREVGYGKNLKLTQEEVELTKYGPGKIEVKLCFGAIVVSLTSKIKLQT